MKLETQPRDDHQMQITAEMDAETLEQYRHRAGRKIAQQAKIPGFRPGKAPYDVIRRTYGDEVITQEAIELLVDDMYPEILKQADIKPSGPGSLEQIISIDPPKLSFIVPLEPVVAVGAYRDIRHEYNLPEVTEEEIEQFLTRLRRSYSTAEPVERAAQQGDQVACKVSAAFTQPAEGEAAQIIEDSPLTVEIGGEEEETAWPFAGFGEYLVGLAAEQDKTFVYPYPEDSPYDKLRGKEVEFSVHVESVKEMKLPELDDEFASTLGQFENIEAVRKAVQESIENQHRQTYDNQYYEELLEKITADSTVKYPPHMLEEEIEEVLKSMEENLSRQHVDLETFLKIRETTREKYIEEEVKPIAEKRLTRSLLMDELVRSENIELGQDELQEAFSQALNELSQTVDLSKIKAKDRQKRIANAVAMEATSRLMSQRLLERLKALATGKADEPKESETAAESAPAEDAEATA